MSIENFYEVEALIAERCDNLFSPGMIFKQSEIKDLDNQDFTNFPVDEDKVGLLIRQSGFSVDELAGKSSFKQQKIKFLYQLIVVCPSDLYDNVGGIKTAAVIRRLLGHKLSNNYTELKLVSDERDFNEPEFMNDLAYTPMLFQVMGVISGEN